jgi:hypothetical protein
MSTSDYSRLLSRSHDRYAFRRPPCRLRRHRADVCRWRGRCVQPWRKFRHDVLSVDSGPQRGRPGHVRKIARLRSRATPLGAALREGLSPERYSRCARSARSLGTTRRRGRHFQLSRVVYRIKTERRRAPSLPAFCFSISTSDAAFVAGLRHHRNPTGLVAVAYLVARAHRRPES